MTHLLPPSLIRLFAPRPPLEYVAPIRRFDPDPHSPPLSKDPSRISRRKTVQSPLTGVASFLERVKQETADRGETTDDIALSSSSSTLTLSRATLREIELEKSRSSKTSLKQHHLSTYSPTSNPDATSDPYKTLFLARLSYDTTESDLHKEFDMYGPIETVKVVRDKEGKSRGYAFIAYERERDMKAAYKDAEGIKIKGRRIMVDVERGRTVKDWKPMRLGGGLGGNSRKPKKTPEPLDPTPASGGGFHPSSGGFRGRGASNGFRGGSRGGGFSQRGAFRGGFNNGPRNNFAPPPPQQRGYRDYPPNNYQQRPYDDPSAPPAKRSRY